MITINNCIVCTHPHIKMREWGVEALCNLGEKKILYHFNKVSEY
jgi:hypothetical protein